MEHTEEARLAEHAQRVSGLVGTFARESEALVHIAATVAELSSGDPDVFRARLDSRVAGSALASVSLVRVGPDGVVELATSGRSRPLVLSSLSESEVRHFAGVLRGGGLDTVKVTDVGGFRVVAFAASAGGDRAVYAESVFPAVDAFEAFGLPGGVRAVLYLKTALAGDAPVMQTSQLPSSSGTTVTTPVNLAGEEGVLVLGADSRLVQGLAAHVALIVLAAGLLIATFVATVVEVHRRRVAAAQERRALEEQNRRLRELDRLKDELVAVVSHELRTPLTSVLGYLGLVREEAAGLTDEHRTFLGVAERNAERLLGLVEDLLFLARFDAGGLSVDVTSVDVEALGAEAVAAQRAAAREAGVKLELEAAPAGLPTVAGDPTRLRQLLDNLLANAVKFTPSGGRVVLRARAAGLGVVLEVEDTGVGIPRGELGRVFDRFFRASTATHAAVGGTGLGLAIVKAIAEAHGGDVAVESVEGVGTTFRVELPAVSAGAPHPLAGAPA